MDSSITTADITRLVQEIADMHARVSGEPATALRAAMDAGDRLTVLKAQLPHGRFTPTLKHIGVSPQSARVYMRLATNRDQIKAAGCTSIREALRLLSPPRTRQTRTHTASSATSADYQRGYAKGWRDRGAAQTRATSDSNGNGARAKLSVRDLKFTVRHFHPDTTTDADIARANRITAWLNDELAAART